MAVCARNGQFFDNPPWRVPIGAPALGTSPRLGGRGTARHPLVQAAFASVALNSDSRHRVLLYWDMGFKMWRIGYSRGWQSATTIPGPTELFVGFVRSEKAKGRIHMAMQGKATASCESLPLSTVTSVPRRPASPHAPAPTSAPPEYRESCGLRPLGSQGSGP